MYIIELYLSYAAFWPKQNIHRGSDRVSKILAEFAGRTATQPNQIKRRKVKVIKVKVEVGTLVPKEKAKVKVKVGISIPREKESIKGDSKEKGNPRDCYF